MKASLIACRLFVAGNPVSFGPPESYIYWSNDSWQGYPCPIGRRAKAWLSTVHVSSAAGMNNRIAPNAHFPRVLRRSIDCGTHMCGSIPHHKHVTPGRQGRNEGEQGGHNPQTPNHWMTAGDAENSEPCLEDFLQYSKFASERRQFRTWGRQTCFFPRAPLTSLRP